MPSRRRWPHHCAGLNAANFQRLARDGGTMVWSPLSNPPPYGKTAIAAARRWRADLAGVGSPSGSKNLLGEPNVPPPSTTLPDDVLHGAGTRADGHHQPGAS
jgi:hypothetical protein